MAIKHRAEPTKSFRWFITGTFGLITHEKYRNDKKRSSEILRNLSS